MGGTKSPKSHTPVMQTILAHAAEDLGKHVLASHEGHEWLDAAGNLKADLLGDVGPMGADFDPVTTLVESATGRSNLHLP